MKKKKRDPRINPKENDRLYKRNSEKFLIIDFIKEDYIYYRVFSNDTFLFAAKTDPDRFTDLAIKDCKPPGGENEKR